MAGRLPEDLAVGQTTSSSKTTFIPNVQISSKTTFIPFGRGRWGRPGCGVLRVGVLWVRVGVLVGVAVTLGGAPSELCVSVWGSVSVCGCVLVCVCLGVCVCLLCVSVVCVGPRFA